MVDELTEGRRIGRYVLCEEIASGGMATVHLGRLVGPEGFSRIVAIKRAHPQFAKDEDFVAMFLEEARLAARITHRNVVPTLDVVAAEGEVLLVMEYVPGESLSRLLRLSVSRGERVPLSIACSIMSDLLRGLHAAHEATDARGEPLEIVHRDVSPHNVLVGRDGTTRVLDFGIAKALSRASTTKDGHVKGKLAYMAPEQLAARSVDRRADIFAAGIIFWELLTGRRLFEGTDHGAIVARILFEPIERPSHHAQFPSELETIVMRALEVQALGRYATAEQMARALEAVMSLSPPAHVGDWVESLAGERLSRRAAQARSIESATLETDPNSTRVVEDVPTAQTMTVPSNPSVPEPSAAPPTGQSRTSEASSPGPGSRSDLQPAPGRVPRRVAAMAAIVAGVAGVAAWSMVRAPRIVPAPPSIASSTSAPSEPAQSATPAIPALSADPVSSTSARPPAPADRADRAQPAQRTRVKPGCNPNYYFDDAGLKHFKRQCL